MKKTCVKMIVCILALVTVQFGLQSDEVEASSQTYTIKNGDTLYFIGKDYGVSIQDIKDANRLTSNLIYSGQKLVIPTAVSDAEKDVLARLVQAEAVGEPYAGKVAVAVVVLNRVSSSLFPNTIKDVIYQPGQFTPVANGAINKPANADSMRAVNEALALKGMGNESLYFYNPKKTSNKWLRSKQVTVIIGNHTFAK